MVVLWDGEQDRGWQTRFRKQPVPASLCGQWEEARQRNWQLNDAASVRNENEANLTGEQ